MAGTKSYTEEFLNEYRNMEQIIRKIHGENVTCRDMEMELNDNGNEIGEKMYVLRVIRNYASHHSDMNGFLPLPKETAAYAKDLCKYFEASVTRAKNNIKKLKPLELNHDLSYAAERLGVNDMMPVVDEKGNILFMMTDAVIRKAVSAGLSSKIKMKKLAELIKIPAVSGELFVKPEKPMSEILEILKTRPGVLSVIVTDNGNPKGKYIGVVKP